MKRILNAGLIFCLIIVGSRLFGQENPTESSNLYDRMGVIVERGLHGAVPEENIDLFSGSLVLKNLDITLPGPNGFDLNIWRVYNSKVNTEYTNTTYSYPQQETGSWVGYGWSMHMGRLQNPDSSNPVIEMPDGRQEATYPWIYDSSILISRNFLQLKKNNPLYGNHHTVHFQDGTVWEFGASAILWLKAAQVPVALVTRIVNSYGHEISIEYYPNSSKLKQITDALGRIIYFNLDGNGNLDSITVPHCNTTVTYDYSVEHPGWGDSAYTKLTEIHPPALNPVAYTYDANTKELIQVNTSYGGTITYSFADQDFAYFDDTMHTRALSSKTLQFESGNSAAWNYVYGDFSGTYTLQYQNLSTGESVNLNGGFTIVNGPESIERVWFLGPQSDSAYGWMSGLLAYKETFKKDGSASIAQEQHIKEPEPISSEIIYVRGRSWGAAAAALETGGFQEKIGTASQYVQYQYSGAARKYGLFSIKRVAAPYDAGSPASAPRKTSTFRIEANKPLFFISGGERGKTAGSKMASATTFYPRYGTVISYAFEGNADFEARNMLTLVSQEIHVDQDNNIYKNSLYEYYDSGAIKKTTRWKQGGVTLEWNYTYQESATEGPKEITITVDPPGDAGAETTVYRNGTLASKEKPDFVEYERTVFPDGLIQTETNQHGGTMTFAYDDAGRITSIAMPAGFNPVNAAWSQNSVAITRGGNTLTKYWDGMGRNLGFEESGTGMPTLYSRKTLDGEGRVISESKGAINNAHRIVYSLNENGQPLQVTDPTGKWTKFAYADNTCVITDMKGNQKTLAYEYLPGLVTRVEQESTEADSFYKGENRLFVVEVAASGEENRIQVYYQNGLDQLVQEQHPETGTINYEYNDEGNLSSKSWGGAVISYTYNASNQLMSENDGDETISFVYDDHGRVREVNSSLESWRRFDIAYNALGAVTSEKQSIDGLGSDKTIEYGYDGNGLLSLITYPDGRVASYGNNALMLPVSLSFNSEANRVSGAAYGVNKQPLGYNLGNGTAFFASYDHAGRVASSGLGFGGTTLFSATYGYDDVGNIASLTNTTPTADAAFQYDAFNRLTKATYPEKIYDYAYDPFGNMLAAKENGLTVFNKSYSPANRISDFSYDSRGNQTGGNGFTQVWDKRNRLVESRTSANVLLGSYVYNERGLRIKAERISQPMVQVVEPNGGESLYLGAMNTVSWSGLGLAGGTVKLELLVDGAVAGTIAEGIPGELTSYQWQAGKMLGGWASPGTSCKVRVTAVAPPVASGTTYYFYDSGGRLLSEYDGFGACAKDYLYLGGKMIGEFVPSTGSYYYYAADQINSTRLVTDSTGVIVHSAQYDPYGGLYKTWVDAYHPKPGFSGKEREFGSEMDYFGARYYGHGEYRFISVDPELSKDNALSSSQDWNLYAYCGNNPISNIDPDGGTLWDIVDYASFVSSLVSMVKKPSLEHAGNLLLDTVGLIPVVPALGTVKKVLNIVHKTHDVKKGITILGKYDDYIKLANTLGANRFNVPPEIWAKMTKVEQWAANRKFLDRMIARGDKILLSNRIDDINKVTGGLRQELDYLVDKGFVLSNDGMRMVKK